ncbi:hypothetical protein HMPREF1144_5744 [Klebsiella sp. OBRC7]|nr:hypothetical protein HMPREF1144_5744 [Klebsiella sp. OBRC7]
MHGTSRFLRLYALGQSDEVWRDATSCPPLLMQTITQEPARNRVSPAEEREMTV